ncbi:hypothetical protein [Ammoniphilus resinae]|uniref:Lipoprotein n=1 Tax=Ammoniphilus resinae TaxID=861532 RepID=A0ABS4GT61_9BACL|nr:hypothetical protein [Ammoniphilus resinae]MBP1933463.1 hypothetical protein [Ammoniphilus resinae]
MKRKKMRKIRLLILGVTMLSILFVSGCMYPKERLMENQLPLMEQVSMVQAAIDEFHEATKVLPILTKEADTPIFEKYVIDFSGLVPRYMPYVPGGAFEQGGPYLFVLTDVETNPTVRLLDLRVVDTVSTVQSRVSYYYQKNNSLPVEGVIRPGYFTINFSQIGIGKQAQTIESPISGKQLPIIMSSTGQVGVDYTEDLELVLKNNNLQAASFEDVREIIPQNSIYVPVKSFYYDSINGKVSLAPFK